MPSSLAPGASAVAFITSLTRLSIWPVMMTTSLGRSVPRWMATALHTLVGVGTRAAGDRVAGLQRRQAELASSRASAQRTAAPIPRLGSVCDDKVWRVPKPTSRSTVAFIRAASTAAAICAQPRVLRGRRGGGAAVASKQGGKQ